MNGEKLVQNIRAIVISKGMRMKDIYPICDVTSGALSQWKSGKTKPHTATLDRIASCLGVSVQDLLEGTENEKPASVSADGLDAIDQLSPALVEELSRFVRLAKANPERALRFLAFANQEIESQI